MLADPRRGQAGEMGRHLGVGERPARRRLGDHAGVVRLPGDRRRDPRRRLIGAVGAGAVADEDVQAAVRGDQRQPPGRPQVAERGRGQPDRHGAGERRRGKHRRAPPLPEQPRQQPGADRRRDDQRVRAVQREQRRQQPGASPRGPAIALDGAAVDQRQRGDQHRIERRLQQHDLVEGDDAGAGQQHARDEAGGVAEPVARTAHRAGDGHHAQRRLHHPRRQQRATGEAEDGGEHVDVERRDREGAALERPGEHPVAGRDARCQRDVPLAVEAASRLEQRMVAQLHYDKGLHGRRHGQDRPFRRQPAPSPPHLGGY